MGYLSYGFGNEYELDDRTLAHLQAAIGQKLRKKEYFFVTWATPVEQGSGSTTIWVSPDLPLTFRFSGNRQPEINPVWLNALCSGASSEGGLFLISEKDAEAQAKITALDSQNN